MMVHSLKPSNSNRCHIPAGSWPVVGTTGPGPGWPTSFSLRFITQCWCRLQVPCSRVTVPAPSPESPASPVLLGRNKHLADGHSHGPLQSAILWASSLFPSPKSSIVPQGCQVPGEGSQERPQHAARLVLPPNDALQALTTPLQPSG